MIYFDCYSDPDIQYWYGDGYTSGFGYSTYGGDGIGYGWEDGEGYPQ